MPTLKFTLSDAAFLVEDKDPFRLTVSGASGKYGWEITFISNGKAVALSDPTRD